MLTPKMFVAGNSDAQLVEGSLMGDRAAFARIVKRYQSLVCSITYNATGSLSLSEDLAQETFLAAWKQLPDRPGGTGGRADAQRQRRYDQVGLTPATAAWPDDSD